MASGQRMKFLDLQSPFAHASKLVLDALLRAVLGGHAYRPAIGLTPRICSDHCSIKNSWPVALLELETPENVRENNFPCD